LTGLRNLNPDFALRNLNPDFAFSPICVAFSGGGPDVHATVSRPHSEMTRKSLVIIRIELEL
jgi:hypothetical protein